MMIFGTLKKLFKNFLVPGEMGARNVNSKVYRKGTFF